MIQKSFDVKANLTLTEKKTFGNIVADDTRGTLTG